MTMFRTPMWPVLATCVALITPQAAGAADEPTQNPPATASAGTEDANTENAQNSDPKELFAAQCGWCHGDYGMQAGKGPRLAGTKMTEHQVEERIRNGKPGYMPSFRKALDDGQIALMAKYIKSLKPQD
jgi:mono/diheme cytochrome c family protein